MDSSLTAIDDPWYVFVRYRNWKNRIKRRVIGVSCGASEEEAIAAALKACLWGWWRPSRMHRRGYRVSISEHPEDLIEAWALRRSKFDPTLIQDIVKERPNGCTV